MEACRMESLLISHELNILAGIAFYAYLWHLKQPISLSYAMRPGLQIRHFWVAKSLFLTITFHQKKQYKTFCF